jgi:recombination protein RecR
MRKFPEPIQNLVAAFMDLPGVGPKTALRYVYSLLSLSKDQTKLFGKLIQELPDAITICRNCLCHTQNEICEICSDPKRENQSLCIVEFSRDIATMEATQAYRGYYFVFGGTLNPLEGQTPETLHWHQLLKYLEIHPQIQEIILAFSPDVLGETTMMYLARQLKPFKKQITRLARGLPTGASLEFADEVTLGDAFKGRREMGY